MSSLGIEWGAKYTLVGPDGTTVVFNDSSDPNFIGVLSPESSGLDSPDVREDATDATEEDGGHHGDFFEGRRPVVLQGTIIASSATQRNERVGKLKRATRALRRDATLTWKIAGGVEVELALRRQQPLRVTKGYTKDFQVGMVAADIFPKSVADHTSTLIFDRSFIDTTKNIDRIAINATHIYYSNKLLTGIGRSKLDGSEVNDSFAATENGPTGIDLNSTYVYWGSTAGKIGRMTLAGGSINNAFATVTGPNTVAVNATHIFYGNELGSAIGRCTIAGGSIENSWLSIPGEGIRGPRKIVVNSEFIYYASGNNDIGRATIAGASLNQSFINVTGVVSTLDVDANFIYWAGGTSRKTIGRAKLNGTEIDEEWINLGEEVEDIWVQGEYLYYASAESGGQIGKIALKTVNEEVVMKNEGDTGAAPMVKLTGPGSTFRLENATTEEAIVLEGVELGATDYFEIDFRNHTIKKNGTTYAYNALNFAESEWWKIEPGENQIVVTGGTAEFTWRDTYI